MAVDYCENCDVYVDLDYNAEHFTSEGDCFEKVISDISEEFSCTDDEASDFYEDYIEGEPSINSRSQYIAMVKKCIDCNGGNWRSVGGLVIAHKGLTQLNKSLESHCRMLVILEGKLMRGNGHYTDIKIRGDISYINKIIKLKKDEGNA